MKEDGTIYSLKEMCKMCNISWDYISIVDAIPREWKSNLKTITSNKQRWTSNTDNKKQFIILPITTGRNQTPINKMKNRVLYNIFRNNINETSIIENKLIEYYQGNVDTSFIYSLPCKITRSTTLQYFQFELTHGYQPTNACLNKMSN